MSDSGSRFLPDEAATLAFGAALALAIRDGAVVHLHGELGAGKTTLCRGLLQALGHTGAVKSPTYTLVESYRFGERSLFHFDLYRLGSPEELEFLGIRDYLEPGAVLLIEWPACGAGHLPPADLELRLSLEGAGRRIDWQAASARGKAIMAAAFPGP